MSPPTQREFWSGAIGQHWAQEQRVLDRALEPFGAQMLALAELREGHHALDVGCGCGATTLEVARQVGASGSALGVDLSPQMLAVARARCGEFPYASFLEQDAAQLAAERPFDRIVSRFGVMFFEQPGPALAHLRSLLAPGGRFAFVCWQGAALNEWASTPLRALAPMLPPAPPPDPRAPGPFAFGDAEYLRGLLRDAGFARVTLAETRPAMVLGDDVESAVEFCLHTGPAARALRELGGEEHLERARELLRPVLAAWHDGAAVRAPAAAWLVSAEG